MTIGTAVVLMTGICGGRQEAQAQTQGTGNAPALALADNPPSVYAPPAPPRENEGVNNGGAHLDFNLDYMSEYIYRGLDYSKVAGNGHAADEQFDARLEFDTAHWPHPFLGVFGNILDSDPVSRFQEFRPYGGLELTLRPLTITVGDTYYVYPEREQFNTSEVFSKLTVDDGALFGSTKPVFTPYFYGAYDYNLNKGFYLETGIKHEFAFEDWPLKITTLADIGYVNHIHQQFVFVSPKAYGFQHYDVGLKLSYSLNALLGISDRFGKFSLEGSMWYTGGIQRHDFNTVDQLWGGAGFAFHY
jgi:hypothetical protein